MAMSETLICNIALGLIGEPNISSLDEQTKAGRLCSSLYPVQRDIVLADHDWNFATKISTLVALSSETIPGWTYLYQMPSRCLCVRRVFNSVSDENNPDAYRVVNSPSTGAKSIASNLESAYAEFTVQVIDPTVFDIKFIDALTYKLAACLAMPLCADTQLAGQMAQFYTYALDRAKLRNKWEGTEAAQQPSPITDAR